MEAFIIGDKSVVTGFRLVGISGESVSDKSEALDALEKVMKMEHIGIILVTDDFSHQIQSAINDIRSKNNAPIIVEISRHLEVAGGQTSTQKLMQKIMRIRA